MKTLDNKIKESIENKKEFNLLQEFNLYCSGEILTEFYINICLDLYNKLIPNQMKYFAKYDALRLTCLYIADENGVKVK